MGCHRLAAVVRATSYVFPAFPVGRLQLFDNTGAARVLSAVLLARGYMQFARPETGA
jgi:hypothetical protein